MTSYLVDTNYILRYLLNDIPSQADTVEMYFRKAKSEEIQITVPLLVFVEADFNLSQLYHFKKAKIKIVDIIYSLVKLPYLDIEKYDLLLKSLLFYAKNNISFVDALFLTEAKNTGKELLTFDKKLKQLKA